MITAFVQDASAFTASPISLTPRPSNDTKSCLLPGDSSEQVRHLLFGSFSAVRYTIVHLHSLGYADPNDWSRPISTGRPNEVMSILTKRISTV